MLHRASNHSTKLDAFRYWQKRLDALYLPWLCPSLYGSIRSGSRRSSTTAAARLVTPPVSCLSKPAKTLAQESKRSRRGLASAVTAGYEIPQDQYIPFEASLDIEPPTQGAFDRRWLPPVSSPVTAAFDPDSALIINENLTTQPHRFRAINATAISGEVAEIRQTVRACVQVDRLERAATLMRRLNEIYQPNASELIMAHNDYLRELVHKVRCSKDSRMLRRMQRWFEVDLRGIGVVPDAVTYALMIQAALQDSKPKRVDRTVKRYMSLADEAGLRDNVMQLVLVMSGDQDTGRITQIAPSQPIFATATSDQSEGPAGFRNVASTTASTVLSDIPEIKTTATKGLGMATLKTSLSSLSDQPLSLPGTTEPSTEAENYQARAIMRQQRLETSTYDAALERWREEMKKLTGLGVNMALKNAPISGLVWTWYEALCTRIKEEISQANKAENANPKQPTDIERCLYGPFLQILPVEKISAITILNCINYICMKKPGRVGIPITGLLKNVGNAVEEESCAQIIRNEGDARLWKSIDKDDRIRKLSRMIMRRRRHRRPAELLEQAAHNVERHESLAWATAIKVRIGAVLVSHLIQSARIGVTLTDPTSGSEVRESQPALVHSYRYFRGTRMGIIRFNKALGQKLAEEPVSCTFAKYLPMIVEPRPWVGYRNGAFLQHPAHVVRQTAGDYHAKRYAKVASENGDMNVVFASLDVLARTPWRINRFLFEVMVAAWNSGEGLGKIPPANPTLTYPEEPPPEEGKAARMKWIYDMKDIDNKLGGIHSNRCFQNFQLEVARAYLDEVFYFPHNVDFRGRAYPMVPFFNHMAADPGRSLLIFANGKELGEKGLRWIKIHLASLYGLTKATHEDREKFTQDHLSDIFDSATRPLDGNRWWLQADDPWQCLATCIELRRALQSPDPRRFVSHLPIHQDGTCNGLQHYAALGGDKLGAEQVNLAPADRPGDVYSTVADMVRAEIVAEAAQGDEIAKLLEHAITRKVVKQTVMTNVYGVTFIGAVRQVERQLEDSGISFPVKNQKLSASMKIVHSTFKALATMFFGATKIQHWLTDCARRICRAVTPEQILILKNPSASINKENRPLAEAALTGKKPKSDGNDLFISTVIWTSPLKMPIVQPYRNHTRQVVETHLQKISIVSPTMMDTCQRRKQVQAFPPNFIHSLDASHMMLTALKCNEMGLTFAAVHDSFWTHAGDVDTMNEILREAFVRMHSEDIIGRLRSEFILRYKGCMQLLSIPCTSNAGMEIRRWRQRIKYKKSKGRNPKAEELLQEVRRLELLGSDKLEERLEGQAMETAGSIYSEFAESCHIHIPDESQIAGLEDVSIPEVLTEQQTDDGFGIGDVTTLGVNETEEEENHEATLKLTSESTSTSTPESTSKARKVWVWVPLIFPPVPEKGNFNVSDVNHSKYFFC